MPKKVLILSLVALAISSCTVKEDIQDNIDHYKELTRIHDIREISYAKNTDNIQGARFLVANYPDQVLEIDGKDFDERYKKLVDYLQNSGYTVMVNEKMPQTATVIAELDKPLPDLKYVGIAMEQNNKMDNTLYNIFYGGNKFKARELFNNYKKTL
jgi:hypothetical protein